MINATGVVWGLQRPCHYVALTPGSVFSISNVTVASVSNVTVASVYKSLV